MDEKTLQLPWGNETLPFELPPNWRLSGILEPAHLPIVPNPQAEVQRSLGMPIGMPRLGEIYKPGMKVVVVIDDGSRPTPVAQILPVVVGALHRAGMPVADLTVVPAIGLHRGMERSEIAARVGLPDMKGLHWENPRCDEESSLVYLGTTSRGTPVWVYKTVAQADLIVSIGCIEPHIIASFGGGVKNLIPGVAGRATIAHNHSLNCTPDTFNMVGQPIERNPMRMDLEEAARMLKGTVYIVNAVLNSQKEVVQIVSGDGIEAHREGVRTSEQLYGVSVAMPADVVITDSHPMDQDLRQGVKALANTIRAVRPGGLLITLVRAEEGVGVFGLADLKLPLGRSALQTLSPAILPFLSKLKLKGVGEEDRFFLYFALQAMHRATLLMLAPTIPVEVRERLPFVQFAESMKHLMYLANVRFPESASVLVFPYGGTTYPVFAN